MGGSFSAPHLADEADPELVDVDVAVGVEIDAVERRAQDTQALLCRRVGVSAAPPSGCHGPTIGRTTESFRALERDKKQGEGGH